MNADRSVSLQTQVLRLDGTLQHEPAIDLWLQERRSALGQIATHWFGIMRASGDEVRELLHDGCPVACFGDAPFGYVNVFTSHVNVGFFQGSALHDAAGLLQGSGKFMRHVKLKPETITDVDALK